MASREDLLKRARKAITAQGIDAPETTDTEITAPSTDAVVLPQAETSLPPGPPLAQPEQLPEVPIPTAEEQIRSPREALIARAKGLLPAPSASAQLEFAGGEAQTPISAAVQGFSQGATALFSDEMTEELSPILNDPNASLRLEAAREEFPFTFGAMESLGLVASPIGRVLRAVGAGGIIATTAEGALFSAGAAEEGEKAKAAGKGGAAGLALSALAGPLGKVFKGSTFVEGALNKIADSGGNIAQKQAAKIISNQHLSNVANAIGDIGTLAVSGGAANVIINNPDDIDTAVDLFTEGAKYSALFGVAYTTARGAAKGVSGAVLKRKRLETGQKIGVLKNQIDEAGETLKTKEIETEAAKMDRKLQQTSVQKNTKELSKIKKDFQELQTQEAKLESMAASREQASVMMADLPSKVDDLFTNTSLRIQQGTDDIVARQFGNQTINITKDITNLERVVKSAEGLAKLPEAQQAATGARNLLSRFKAAAQFTAKPKILGGGPAVATMNGAAAYQLKKELGQLLYDKDWYRAAGASGLGLRGAAVEFERSLRGKLGSLDASGQFARNSNIVHNLLNAKRTASRINWEQAAKSPSKSKIVGLRQELEGYLTPDQELRKAGINAKGFSDDVFNHPHSAAEMKAVKSAYKMTVEPTMSLWHSAEEATRVLPKVKNSLNKTRSNLAKVGKKIGDESLDLREGVNKVKIAEQRARQAGLSIDTKQLQLSHLEETLKGGVLKQLSPLTGGAIEDLGRGIINSPITQGIKGVASQGLPPIIARDVIPSTVTDRSSSFGNTLGKILGMD